MTSWGVTGQKSTLTLKTHEVEHTKHEKICRNSTNSIREMSDLLKFAGEDVEHGNHIHFSTHPF